MQTIRQNFTVDFNYPVHFTRDLLNPENLLLMKAMETGKTIPRLMAVVDSGLVQANPSLLSRINDYFTEHSNKSMSVIPPLVVPGGEGVKNNHKWLESIQQEISDARLCRHSFIVVFGGGAVLDLAGYAAATAHRGIRLIRVPTTVLAQCDSGVGVKNGINAFGKKNFLGSFAPPYAVINDSGFLKSLDPRDWRSGIAEAIKVALIKDAEFFRWIYRYSDHLNKRDRSTMERLIHRCSELHMRHIGQEGDPFETGSARPLDFGHWAAHKLEQLTGNHLRHGEAVAIGVALDSTYSFLLSELEQDDWQLILRAFERLGFSLWVPELASEELFEGLEEFREHLGGELTLTLLDGLGRRRDVHQVDLSLYRRAIEMLSSITAEWNVRQKSVAG